MTGAAEQQAECGRLEADADAEELLEIYDKLVDEREDEQRVERFQNGDDMKKPVPKAKG